MQVNDKVICVYAGSLRNLKTHGVYVVTAVYDDTHVTVADLDGNECGDYWIKRFVLQEPSNV